MEYSNIGKYNNEMYKSMTEIPYILGFVFSDVLVFGIVVRVVYGTLGWTSM